MRLGISRAASPLPSGPAALRVLGDPPLLLDFESVPDDTDHVIAVFRVRGRWGAVAKSNYSGLRYREPAYRGLRELAMSYFEGYVDLRGRRTLRTFSRPVNLARFDRAQIVANITPVLSHGRARPGPIPALAQPISTLAQQQQPGVGGHRRAPELDAELGVEREANRARFLVTH